MPPAGLRTEEEGETKTCPKNVADALETFSKEESSFSLDKTRNHLTDHAACTCGARSAWIDPRLEPDGLSPSAVFTRSFQPPNYAPRCVDCDPLPVSEVTCRAFDVHQGRESIFSRDDRSMRQRPTHFNYETRG